MKMFMTFQFFGACGFLIGTLALIGGFRFRRRARQAETWQPVPARVLEFDLVYDNDTDFPGYAPKIRYQYAFGDGTYESTVFRPILNAKVDETEVDAWQKRYLPGSEITVHVDPNDPSRAAVDKNVPRPLGWGMLLFGGGFAFVGAIMFVVMTVLSQFAPQ